MTGDVPFEGLAAGMSKFRYYRICSQRRGCAVCGIGVVHVVVVGCMGGLRGALPEKRLAKSAALIRRDGLVVY